MSCLASLSVAGAFFRYARFVQACVDILKNNDVVRVAQLKGVSFNDLVFEGTVSAGALPSVFLLLRVASPSRR